MSGPETILVVDDDPLFRDLVRDLLERGGYRVHELADGATAVDVAALEQPTAVVLDFNLPGLNGYEVCQRLREQLDSRARDHLRLGRTNEDLRSGGGIAARLGRLPVETVRPVGAPRNGAPLLATARSGFHPTTLPSGS
jgi:CheY-like chemotaxis protein